MKRLFPTLSWLFVVFVLVVAAGCASNPNIEGARLDLRNKNYQRALDNINEALETEPGSAEALVLKGDIISEMLSQISDDDERAGYIGELASSYAQAVALDPQYLPHVTRQRSTLYSNEFVLAMEVYRDADQLGGRERSDRFKMAARHFRNASMMIPDSVSALINEAHAYYGAGEAQDAADAYEAAIALGHTDRELFIYLARTYELMALELADPEAQPIYQSQMIRSLELARKLYPEDEEIRKLLLNAYAVSEMTEEALPFFEQILSEEQDNQIYLYNYGTLLLKREDYEGAIELLQKAVRLDSSYVNALFNLGAAYVNHGVYVDHQYKAVEDSLQGNTGGLAAQEIARLENRKLILEQSKTELFGRAITHLESAKDLLEKDLADISGVCHALYLAYAQTNQRSRAEEANICARQ
ncbi:MAG: tetratricopeptide repeat protein [Bacteroidetes bacterium]|nr:tetratricopeptide repeat protein [Bacteroidota bacterium]MCY4205523.1 tetratricopeptide repeat protein [Bacteroidota bacterium]